MNNSFLSRLNIVNPGFSASLIWSLSLASVVVYVNLYVMQGMLPLIAEHFHTTPGHATLLLSATVFSLALSLLLMALLSDRFGRRRPIIWSLVLLAITNPLLVYATSFDQLMWLRLMQGIILAVIPATAMACFKDHLTGDWLLKAGAFYIGANSLGGIVGRLIGGAMAQHLTWQESMWCLSLMTAAASALIIYIMPMPKTAAVSAGRDTLSAEVRGFWLHLKDPQMCLVYLIGGSAFMVMVNQFSFIQLHLMSAPYSFSRFEATLIFLCYLSGTWVSFKSAKAIARYGSYKLWRLAAIAMLVGSLMTLYDHILTILLGFLISAWGFFLTHACCNSYVATRAVSHRAKATALYLCCYYLGAALGGPYLMPFWQQGKWPGVVLGSLLVISGLFVLQHLLAKYNGRAAEH